MNRADGQRRCAAKARQGTHAESEEWPDLPTAPRRHSPSTETCSRVDTARRIRNRHHRDSRFSLYGAALQTRGESLCLVATDSHRIAESMASITAPSARSSSRAGHRTTQTTCEKGDDPVEIAENDNHIFASSDRTLIICRKVAVKFPDYERIFPTAIRNPATVNRLELRDALAAAGVFSNRKPKLTQHTKSC